MFGLEQVQNWGVIHWDKKNGESRREDLKRKVLNL